MKQPKQIPKSEFCRHEFCEEKRISNRRYCKLCSKFMQFHSHKYRRKTIHNAKYCKQFVDKSGEVACRCLCIQMVY